MKTRNILMFTASVTSLSSVSTADSDNILAVEQSPPVIAVAVASSAIVQAPVIATTVSGHHAVG